MFAHTKVAVSSIQFGSIFGIALAGYYHELDSQKVW